MVVHPKGPRVFCWRKPYELPPRPPVTEVPDVFVPDDFWYV
jgi:hypothetical protein